MHFEAIDIFQDKYIYPILFFIIFNSDIFFVYSVRKDQGTYLLTDTLKILTLVQHSRDFATLRVDPYSR